MAFRRLSLPYIIERSGDNVCHLTSIRAVSINFAVSPLKKLIEIDCVGVEQ